MISGGKRSRSSACISYCFSSSREKMISFFGDCSARTRPTNRRPKEPVPPVINTTLPSRTRVLGAKLRWARDTDAAKPTRPPRRRESPRERPILAQCEGGRIYQNLVHGRREVAELFRPFRCSGAMSAVSLGAIHQFNKQLLVLNRVRCTF